MGNIQHQFSGDEACQFLKNEAIRLSEFYDNVVIHSAIRSGTSTMTYLGSTGDAYSHEEVGRLWLGGHISATGEDTPWITDSLEGIRKHFSSALILVNTFSPPNGAAVGCASFGNRLTMAGVVREWLTEEEEKVRRKAREDDED